MRLSRPLLLFFFLLLCLPTMGSADLFKRSNIWWGIPISFDVPITTVFEAHFTKPMNTNTLTSDTLFLTQKGQDQKIEATLHYDSQRLKATLIPKTPLSQNTDYTLHLTNEITSEKGVSSKPQTALAFSTSPTDAELKDA